MTNVILFHLLEYIYLNLEIMMVRSKTLGFPTFVCVYESDIIIYLLFCRKLFIILTIIKSKKLKRNSKKKNQKENNFSYK
jgi:hypothetical protein